MKIKIGKEKADTIGKTVNGSFITAACCFTAPP
jgi:hypothetical protein